MLSLSRSFTTYHIRSFRQIRSSLENTDFSVATVVVSCRLDYANSILFGCPLKYCSWLQRVQNALAIARITTSSELLISFKVNYCTASTFTLASNRLPYQFQTLYTKIQSAIGSLSCKSSPQLQPPRTMRSSSAKLLTVLRHNLSLSSRAFHISAPTTWNSLPQNVRECSCLSSFRNHLKTHYISSAFSVFSHLAHMRFDSNWTTAR